MSKQSLLAPASITKITRELIDAHLVKEIEFPVLGLRGRPAIGLVIESEGWQFLSIRIENGSISLALKEINTQTIVEQSYPFHVKGNDEFSNTLSSLISHFFATYSQHLERVTAISIILDGLIEPFSGVIYKLPDYDIDHLSLGHHLTEQTGLPTYIQPYVNTLALTDYFSFHAKRTAKNIIYLQIDDVVSAAIINNGIALDSHTRRTIYFGHGQIQNSHESCYCGGIGCLERSISIPAILKRIPKLFHLYPETSLLNEEINFDNFCLGIETEDPLCLHILDNIAQILAGTSVVTKSFITQGDLSYQINGLNRVPGKLLNCGGYESKPTEKPVHDFVCHNDNEVIAYNRMYGNHTPNVTATEIIINKRGDIISYSDKVNTKIESDKTYIQVTGNKKLELKKDIPVKLVHKVFIDNKEFTLKPGITMISAGPSLLVNGNIPIEIRATQGWDPYPKIKDLNQSQDDDGLSLANDSENREGFYEGWVLRRHPRTAIGITKDNVLFIAVVYGRNPTNSEGATITEMGRLMKALGAITAMNLDGGGSSVMIVDGKPTGPFSDEEERLVSDAILLIKNN
nr:ROK family protein [Providencia sp. wls1948]